MISPCPTGVVEDSKTDLGIGWYFIVTQFTRHVFMRRLLVEEPTNYVGKMLSKDSGRSAFLSVSASLGFDEIVGVLDDGDWSSVSPSLLLEDGRKLTTPYCCNIHNVRKTNPSITTTAPRQIADR